MKDFLKEKGIRSKLLERQLIKKFNVAMKLESQNCKVNCLGKKVCFFQWKVKIVRVFVWRKKVCFFQWKVKIVRVFVWGKSLFVALKVKIVRLIVWGKKVCLFPMKSQNCKVNCLGKKVCLFPMKSWWVERKWKV